MQLEVNEYLELHSKINKTTNEAYDKGVKDGKTSRPNTDLYEALLEFGVKTGKLKDSSKGNRKDPLDDIYYITLIVTTPAGKDPVMIEINFKEDLNTIESMDIYLEDQ